VQGIQDPIQGRSGTEKGRSERRSE